MPRKSKPKMTTPPTIYTIPFTEPFTEPFNPLPVTPPLTKQSIPTHIPKPPPPPSPPEPLNEQEEEHQHYIKMCEAMDNLPILPRVSKATVPTIIKTDTIPVPSPITVEYSLADLAGEQESSREQIQCQPVPVTQAAPHPVTSAPPPATAIPAEQGSVLPRITRHRGQTVQTFKAIYVMTPIQYRAAFDKLKKRTRRTGKEVLCEAIGDCAVKHGLVSKPGAIMGWPDWD